jgi:hypothetical protein
MLHHVNAVRQGERLVKDACGEHCQCGKVDDAREMVFL